MDMVSLGKIIKTIRLRLELTQSQFASELNNQQATVSRLERGLGCGAEFIFEVLSYLNSKGMQGFAIFIEPFNIDLLEAKDKNTAIAVLLDEFKKNVKDIDQGIDVIATLVRNQ